MAVAVFNIGWDMIGYQNPALGFVLWAIAGVLILVPAVYWIIGTARERNQLREDNKRLREEAKKDKHEHERLQEAQQERIRALESRTSSLQSPPMQGRIGMRSRGGSDKGKNWKISNQDIGIDSEETERNVDGLEIE